MKPTAIVIGAGISGLTAAYRLATAGWHVEVVEGRGEIGGLARSMSLGRGRIERYYHFICKGDMHLLRLAKELGLEESLRWAPAPMGHFYNGRLYPFSTALDLLRFRPLSFLERLRLALASRAAQRTTKWRPLDKIAAKEWLLKTVGEHVYEVLWRPLLEVKFGPYADEVAAAWLWHRLYRVGTSRQSILRPETMGHFAGGSETLFERLVERIAGHGGKINLETVAVAVRRLRAGEWNAETSGGELSGRAVIMAVPLPVAAALTQQELPEYSSQLAAVPYLGVVCVLLRAERTATPYFWVNINDRRVAFNGFIEYSNLNRSPQAWGGEVLYVPMYLPPDDPRFSWPDGQWAQWFREGLRQVNENYERSVTLEVVTRDIHAQPVCTPGFADRRPAIKAPAQGLFLVEASQLYPSDRCLSGMIGLASLAARRAAELAE